MATRLTPKVLVCLYIFVIVLGLGLRLYQADYELDGDEIFSVEAASGSLSHLLDVAIKDRVHPPLYYVALNFWINLFGASEVAVRALSVFISALFLCFLALVAIRIIGPSAGLLAVAICAICPFFVFFGKQGRPYALIALLSTLSVFFLMKAREQSSSGVWPLLYGAACAALLNTQYLGVLLVIVEVAYFIMMSDALVRRRLLFASICGVLTIIPWILILISQSALGEISQKLSWNPRPGLMDLLFYGSVGIFGWLPVSGSARILLLILILSVLPLVTRWRRPGWRETVLLGALAMAPPLSLFLIATYAPGSPWATRHLIGSAVFLVLLIAQALSLYSPRWLGFSLGLFLVLWSGLALPSVFPSRSTTPWRGIVSSLDHDCADCLVVGQDPMVLTPLRYYSHREVVNLKMTEASRLNLLRPNRIVFVCREPRCEKLNSLTGMYRIEGSRRIDLSESYAPYSVKVVQLVRKD